jgi:thymidylate kinase
MCASTGSTAEWHLFFFFFHFFFFSPQLKLNATKEVLIIFCPRVGGKRDGSYPDLPTSLSALKKASQSSVNPQFTAAVDVVVQASRPRDGARLNPALGHGRTVVIEGLDGVGKSTLVNGLMSVLRARPSRTPPKSLSYVRPIFDNLPETVARAFYMCTNYVAAVEMQNEPDNGRPFVMDRFYHSTASSTIGQAARSVAEVKALPDAAFVWPSDLPMPHLVLLLELNDATRMKRLRARGIEGWGASEERQAQDPMLGARIQAAFHRVSCPQTRVVVLDASQSPEAVLRDAVQACRDSGLL